MQKITNKQTNRRLEVSTPTLGPQTKRDKGQELTPGCNGRDPSHSFSPKLKGLRYVVD